MDDLSNITPQPESRGGRNITIVGGAVLIIIAGFLVVKYWSKLMSPSPVGLPGTGEVVPQKPPTQDEKKQILQSLQPSSSTAQSPPVTPAERAQILQQLSTQPAGSGSSAPQASQLSAEEKMKILQSLQH